VTIPGTVPQRSEITVVLTNYPVFSQYKQVLKLRHGDCLKNKPKNVASLTCIVKLCITVYWKYMQLKA